MRELTGIGYTATSKRSIKPGIAYDRFFPKPTGFTVLLENNGTVQDTVDYCVLIINKTLQDTAKVAPLLKGKTLTETCRNIYDFCYRHYQYSIDRSGIEELRRPSRAWKDRRSGIDCDCFTISVSSILTNLNIPHYLRIVKMYGREYYQHIYVVVPLLIKADMNRPDNYIVIDPVVSSFNKEAPGITFKKDRYMNGMPIHFLNGITTMPLLGTEFNGLGEGSELLDGRALYQGYLRRKKQHLVNTRNQIRKHPHKFRKIYQPQILAGMYDELIGAWDNETSREATLDKLSGMEENALQPYLQGLGDLIHGTDEELAGIINAIDDPVQLEGLGKISLRKKVTGVSKPVKKTGVFTKIKNSTRAVKAIAKSAAGKAGKGIKRVGGNALKAVKKVARTAIKYNPAVIAIRAGYLLAMKTNFGRLASRAYWAYFPYSEAAKFGVSTGEYSDSLKLKNELENRFVKIQGKADNIKKVIVSGRGAMIAKRPRKQQLKSKSVKGLGVVAEASITAALSLLIPILNFANKLFKQRTGKDESPADEENPDNPASTAKANSSGDVNTDEPESDNPGNSANSTTRPFTTQSSSGSSSASSNVESQSSAANQSVKEDAADNANTHADNAASVRPANTSTSAAAGSTGLLLGIAAAAALVLLSTKKQGSANSHSISGITQGKKMRKRKRSRSLKSKAVKHLKSIQLQ